jgi:hypothetical protein
MDQEDQVAPSLDPLGPLEPHPVSKYIASVMIALDHHAQLNSIVTTIVYYIYFRICYLPSLAIVLDYTTKPRALPPYPRLRTLDR